MSLPRWDAAKRLIDPQAFPAGIRNRPGASPTRMKRQQNWLRSGNSACATIYRCALRCNRPTRATPLLDASVSLDRRAQAAGPASGTNTLLVLSCGIGGYPTISPYMHTELAYRRLTSFRSTMTIS
jgi:hypothetical protein